jgi:hypothetical protein
MGNRKDDQKGPQGHAEGQQGAKTQARLEEQQREGEHRESQGDRAQLDRERSANEGGRRLVEDREQHDEAEKNSEHTRLFAEHQRHRDEGPSDNAGNLHGVVDHRESRADDRPRDSRGLRPKE